MTPIVWQISIVHLADQKTWLSGVLLNKAPFTFDKKTSPLMHAFHIAKSYRIKRYANRKIKLIANGEHFDAVTDKNGEFALLVNHYLQADDIMIRDEHDKPCELLQVYPKFFPNTNSPFDVISDIDDTIIISHTVNSFRRIWTIMAKSPQRRKTVDFTSSLFLEFQKHKARVFYVSKSEANLFGLISSIIQFNELPEGPLLLTPYLSFKELLSGKKEKDFKYKRISFLLEHSGNKQYILLGDDSQKDMEVYTNIAKQYAPRIKKIFIRQTKAFINNSKSDAYQKLIATFANTTYFHTQTDIDVELKSLDILSSGDIEQLNS